MRKINDKNVKTKKKTKTFATSCVNVSALNCWLFVMSTEQYIDPLLLLSSIDIKCALMFCFRFVFWFFHSRRHTQTLTRTTKRSFCLCPYHIDSSIVHFVSRCVIHI